MISPGTPTHGKEGRDHGIPVSGAAALTASSKVYLYHQETKTVTKRVHGKKKSVKVAYWRSRGTHTMAASSSGKLTWSGALAYKGSWKMYVMYAGTAFDIRATSATKYFRVK